MPFGAGHTMGDNVAANVCGNVAALEQRQDGTQG
jgi:hypothetical protein